MAEKRKKVVLKLNCSRGIGGVMRQPGHMLIEAVLTENLTADKLELAIMRGAVDFETVPMRRRSRKTKPDTES